MKQRVGEVPNAAPGRTFAAKLLCALEFWK